MSIFTNVAAVAVPFMAFVWGVILHIRDARTRKHAEHAERAGSLVQLLHLIDLGGTDAGLDSSLARAHHDKQIHDLQRVIRVSTAEFSARALRPALSRQFIVGCAAYGLFLLIDGVSLCLSANGLRGSSQLTALLIGGALGATGISGLITAGVLGSRRERSRSRQREAGIIVLTLGEEIRHNVAAVQTWFAVRKLNRTRLREIRPTSAED